MNLHDTVHLLGVLVGRNVCSQLREGNGVSRGRGGGILGEEFIEDFGEDLVRCEGGVLVVTDDDTGDALGSGVDVECKVCFDQYK